MRPHTALPTENQVPLQLYAGDQSFIFFIKFTVRTQFLTGVHTKAVRPFMHIYAVKRAESLHPV